MPDFKRKGFTFSYAEVGKGIPFIFLHGLGGSAEQILKIYSPPSSVRLITFDFRGHGQTPIGSKDQLNFKSFADDTLALMIHLNLDKAVVGGISMGAAVALNFALRYPLYVLGLILSRPAWLDGPMVAQNNVIFKNIARLMQEHGRENGLQLFMASELYNQLSKIAPNAAQSFRNYFDYEHASETSAKFECLPDDAPSHNREEWKEIACATLVLASQSDPVHPYEYGLEYASRIAHAEFREITPKSISEEQHVMDVQKSIDGFIAGLLNKM